MSNRLLQPVLPRIAFAACLLFCSALQPLHAAPASAKPSAARKPAPAVPAPKTVPATYKGAIVINAENGEILFQDNPDILNPPASVAKLMTFLVVHDAIAAGALALDTPVQVTVEDSKIGGTQVWLDPKETFTVGELLHALIIQSANDAASALAHAAAGTREAFVRRMNDRARELGMTRTTFVTPHGLPPASRRAADGDLTTPRDLATLARHLVNNTDILNYTSIAHRPFGQGVRPPDRIVEMDNHNKLLGKVRGVDGLKTGYTAGAGFCLAATASRNGNRLIVVTMGSPDSKSRDLKIIELLDKTFARLPPGNAGSPVPVTSSYPPKRNAADTLGIRIPQLPDAPVPSATSTAAPITPASSLPPPASTPVAPASSTAPSASTPMPASPTPVTAPPISPATSPADFPTVVFPAPK